MRVYEPVARADLRILIGSVLPHLQAGFGGGYKLIFPGTSHRSTLGALHRQGLTGDGDAGLLLGGDAATNPMRRAIQEAAGRLGPCLSISHLIGGPGQVFRVLSGRPEPVQDILASEAKERFRAPPSQPPRTSSWRVIIPGRAIPCRASRSCCTTGRPASPAACSSASSGPTRSRSTGLFRGLPCA